MKLLEIFTELKEKEIYKEFIKSYPDSFLTIVFITQTSEEKGADKLHLDFFIPSVKKLASFEYPFASYKVHEEEIREGKEIKDFNLKTDILDIKEVVKEKYNKEFEKIIGILQDGIWNTTCLSGMDIKRLKINAYTGKIESSGNLNLSDIIQVKKPK